MVCTLHIFFVHSYVYGQLGSFHLLATLNNAAMNMGLPPTEVLKPFLKQIYIYNFCQL